MKKSLEDIRTWSWLRRALGWIRKNPPVTEIRKGVVYAVKEGEALAMDIYLPDKDKGNPIVLFVHGGGFSEGRRDDPRYVRFATDMAAKGFPLVSLSYRLTMKGRSFGCDQASVNKIAAFRAAAEDIWDATCFMLDNAPSLGLHPRDGVVLCGSSAGAEAVLHAAYWPDANLPEKFRYAGIIGMAAALYDLSWIKRENALPMLLFHGIDDPLVPFASDSHHYCRPDQPGFLMLHGSRSIAHHLKALHKPYLLVEGTTGGHGWADKPMFDHTDIILRFLEHSIKKANFEQLELTLSWS